MQENYIENKLFEGVNFSETGLEPGHYENCRFVLCDFSNAQLNEIQFEECVFTDCNLSLVSVTNTMFRDVHFVHCKLVGIHFDKCKELHFKVHFEGCILNISSFFKMKLRYTTFLHCSMQEVDLVDCDLDHATFTGSDMAGAVFENTNLEHADLRTAYNYSIDPEKNRIKKAIFSPDGIHGLLTKYDIRIE